MPNRLASSNSPYLLQHADNPVDWHPWGEEAFALARGEGRPILLSVGYSSCHWCHVMAHESFDDEETAELMNRWFVNVKVDREERPDVDSVYMLATQALSGHGGWPMTVFLTPEGEPFFAGTYFPPEDALGRPGFRTVLAAVRSAWDKDGPKVREAASSLLERLRIFASNTAGDRFTLGPDAVDQAVAKVGTMFDPLHGGFGQAPKFPTPDLIEFLLASNAWRGGATKAPDPAMVTLRQMAAGGIRDHLGGGFHRYSVDREWLVPHFEKMLYDNAQLARLYLHGWQVTREPLFEAVARETLEYLLRDMRDGEGGFHAATDADSEGVEGLYFTWTPDEVLSVLGPEDGDFFNGAYRVVPEGHFQDPHRPDAGRRSILHRPDLAGGNLDMALEGRLRPLRQRLLQARATKVPPGLDDKVLTSWNGLALAAFAEAGRVLGEPSFIHAATALVSFVRTRLWLGREGGGGHLLHVWRRGEASVAGMLEDYSWWGLGLVELFKATGDLEWLRWAADCLDRMVEEFHDRTEGGFFATGHHHEALILREKPVFDGVTPSGNAAAGLLAFWLGRYFGRDDWLRLAEEVLRLLQGDLPGAPSNHGSGWLLANLWLSPRQEIVVVGDPAARAPFEGVVARRFLPSALLVSADAPGLLPVTAGREPPPGNAMAWRCQDMTCDLPDHTPEELAAGLREPKD